MAGKQIKALTKSQAIRAQELYALRDGRGKRVWSIMRLASEYGVGETTIYRAINRAGSYQDTPEALPPADSPEFAQAAAESQARLLRMMEERPAETGPEAIDIFMAEPSVQAKLLKDISVKRGIETAAEELVQELKIVNPLDE